MEELPIPEMHPLGDKERGGFWRTFKRGNGVSFLPSLTGDIGMMKYSSKKKKGAV